MWRRATHRAWSWVLSGAVQHDRAAGTDAHPRGAHALAVLARHRVILSLPRVAPRLIDGHVRGRRRARAPRQETDETAHAEGAGHGKARPRGALTGRHERRQREGAGGE